LMAAFAPFVLLRLVPLVEAGVIAHLEGIERRPVAVGRSAATQAVSLAMGAAGQGATLRTGSGGSNGAERSEPLPTAVATRLPPIASTPSGSPAEHGSGDSDQPRREQDGAPAGRMASSRNGREE
jgi:hypothetical protein